MTRDDELELVRKAQSGSEDAFEKLVLAQQKLVYNLALKLSGSVDDALDVSQDVFLKAFLNLSSFRGESRLSVWLYRLTYNACMDHLKRTRSAAVVPLDGDGDDAPGYDVPDPAPLPEEELEKRELRREVREALMKLPDDKREILLMREYSGMSYAAISEALGLEEGTVKSRISRARTSLAEELRKYGTFSRGGASNGMNKPKGGAKHERL